MFIYNVSRSSLIHSPKVTVNDFDKGINFQSLARDIQLVIDPNLQKSDSAQSAACFNVDLTHLVIFLTGYRSKFDRIFSYNFPFTDCFWSIRPICRLKKTYLA